MGTYFVFPNKAMRKHRVALDEQNAATKQLNFFWFWLCITAHIEISYVKGVLHASDFNQNLNGSIISYKTLKIHYVKIHSVTQTEGQWTERRKHSIN
jgi:hypothetical protein